MQTHSGCDFSPQSIPAPHCAFQYSAKMFLFPSLVLGIISSPLGQTWRGIVQNS